MPRPELGVLAKGRVLLVRDHQYRRGTMTSEMIVVSLGSKWVGLCPERWVGTDAQSSFMRRFLLTDQREGEPGKRVGYTRSFATREQHEWDMRLSGAAALVRDIAGLEVRRGSPFAGEDGIIMLADLLKQTGSSWLP